MKNRFLMLCGVLAPLVYVGTVILGGLIRPGYSHIAQPVSDLIAAGAPNKSLLDPLFGVYNLLTLAFGVGLYQRVRQDHVNPRGRVGALGAWVLVAEGLFGFATLFFPEDAGGLGATISTTGTLHIVLASLSSLTTMLSMLLLGFWFNKGADLRGYGAYSLISVIVVFLSGGLAAAMVAGHSTVAGLAERITIGGFLQWVFVIGLKMFRSTGSMIETID